MFGWKKLINMNPQEKATELIEKFGSNSINQIEYTIDIWETKRKFEINKLNKGDLGYKFLKNAINTQQKERN